MSKLSHDDVLKVFHLARLATDEKKIAAHMESLSNILDFVEQMNNVNTENINPMAHPLNIRQPLRKDEITETDQRTLLQTTAPNLDNGERAIKLGFYLVPKVIE